MVACAPAALPDGDGPPSPSPAFPWFGGGPRYYALDARRRPYPVADAAALAAAMRSIPGASPFGLSVRVAETNLGRFGRVSTVFLPYDYNHARGFPGADPRPLCFETMVFGGPLAGAIFRAFTWEEAARGHDRVAAALRHLRRAGTRARLRARRGGRR